MKHTHAFGVRNLFPQGFSGIQARQDSQYLDFYSENKIRLSEKISVIVVLP